ncbi:hypothetical protein [Bacteroides sp. 51]|uniref:hypothetical protein n=1 Tax=Bacteroides sp. 51 TaxID=2302938 RepID=UPI0013D23BD3|nr:hypothetical protein [Bacteroides sp. 51]NDV84344.1 hypothetical protein [Bacteroides sp. 51]
MPTTEFEKQKEALINDIRTKISEGRELDALINQFNKIMAKKAAKARKAQKASSVMVHSFYSRTRVPSITSLQSTNNVTNEEALQELHKMIETWK